MKPIFIIVSMFALAIIVILVISNDKANQIADRKDYIIELKFKQGTIELYLELQQIPDDKRLSNIEDLNALLEPTIDTFLILK